jgi:inositol phosphorylceramide mannosyltransferase catalytic subunit
MIPKIIHQTWKTRDIPARFQDASASWQALHPDWEYRLWNDDDLETLVAEEFRTHLPLYHAYPDHIQRVDAARYMILFRYGGLYADLDIVCNRPMDDFLNQEVLLAPTKPLGLSNDLMMAEPGHFLFLEIINQLGPSFQHFNRWFVPRHFRVMLTTGPLLVTRVHKVSAYRDRVFLLPGNLYHSQDRDIACVIHIPGDTWAGWDTRLFNFLADSWKSLSSAGIILLLILWVLFFL